MKTVWKKWISQRIVELREKNRLLPRQVAEKLDLQYYTYMAYEKSIAEPSIRVLQLLCKIFGVTVDEFLQGSPSELSPSVEQ